MVLLLLATAHAWLGKFKSMHPGVIYKHIIIITIGLVKLIVAVLTCVVKASDARSKSGQDACTSKSCSWIPTPMNVSSIFYKHIHVQVNAANVSHIQFSKVPTQPNPALNLMKQKPQIFYLLETTNYNHFIESVVLYL